MTAALSLVHNAEDTGEVARVLGTQLDQLPRTSFNAVAEFCALIRDTVADFSRVAGLVGPTLLAPHVGASANSASAATAVMDVLIQEAELVFGRVAGYNKKDSMGIRKNLPQLPQRRASKHLLDAGGMVLPPSISSKSPILPPLSLGGNLASSTTSYPNGSATSEDTRIARDNKRRDQLRAFFQYRANERFRDLSDVVDDLFENHDFEDIARGIYERYSMLPPGWQYDLIELRKQGSQKLGWFDENLINMQKTKNTNGGSISFVPQTSMTPIVQNPGKIDSIINELINTEETYRGILDELHELYIVPVREIALGRKGKERRIRFGIIER